MSELKSLELQFCWQLTDAGVLLVPHCLSKRIPAEQQRQFDTVSATIGQYPALGLQLMMTMCCL